MSVLINGMEMPTSCLECPLTDGHSASCLITEKSVYFSVDKRHDGCPLVPVPPHGRLGDLDRLEQMFADIDHAPYSGFDGLEPFYSAEDAAQIIRLAPTVIPASGGNEGEEHTMDEFMYGQEGNPNDGSM